MKNNKNIKFKNIAFKTFIDGFDAETSVFVDNEYKWIAIIRKIGSKYEIECPNESIANFFESKIIGTIEDFLFAGKKDFQEFRRRFKDHFDVSYSKDCKVVMFRFNKSFNDWKSLPIN